MRLLGVLFVFTTLLAWGCQVDLEGRKEPVPLEMAWATTDAGIEAMLEQMSERQSRYVQSANVHVAKLITPELTMTHKDDKFTVVHENSDPYYIGNTRLEGWGITRVNGASVRQNILPCGESLKFVRTGKGNYSGAMFPLGNREAGVYAVAWVVRLRKPESKRYPNEPPGLIRYAEPAIALVRVKGVPPRDVMRYPEVR